MIKGYIHSIETFGAVDGPGIRYVVFFQGCPIRCLYCHNPDSWKTKQGKLLSVGKIVKDILKYKNYISKGGVTLSGGEPLLQAKFAYKLIKRLHKHNINVALDTAGSIFNKTTQKVLSECDLVLLDIKAYGDDMYKTICGTDSLNNTKTLNYLKEINKPVWIRHVIVPNYTLNLKVLKDFANYLENYKNIIQRVELIPFHKMGEFKWKELNYDYKLYEVNPPSKDDMKKVKEIFINKGFQID